MKRKGPKALHFPDSVPQPPEIPDYLTEGGRELWPAVVNAFIDARGTAAVDIPSPTGGPPVGLICVGLDNLQRVRREIRDLGGDPQALEILKRSESVHITEVRTMLRELPIDVQERLLDLAQ
jgi:hypothetical protein